MLASTGQTAYSWQQFLCGGRKFTESFEDLGVEMEHFKRKFNTPEEAQAFLKSVSEHVGDFCQVMEFNAACVEAQAAMSDLLIMEAHLMDVQRKKYISGDFSEINSQIEIAIAWDNYNRASIEFNMAKKKMQNIINPLYIGQSDIWQGVEEQPSAGL
jgi:hypothetical protein